ncbi:hypothetical protein [Sphingomonas sp.]|uniref:hypothetical protein n=1 Tax=Sphingomonas sp. TaxID=28214 RepID=UPI002DD635B5|nr:hypothetical protein [Sphingomonas sp.]
MTHDEEVASVKVIDFCRTHFRRLGAEEFTKLGARSDDIAIAATAAAVDLAQHHAGDPVAAIAWVRRALEVIEADLPLTVETLQ